MKGIKLYRVTKSGKLTPLKGQKWLVRAKLAGDDGEAFVRSHVRPWNEIRTYSGPGALLLCEVEFETQSVAQPGVCSYFCDAITIVSVLASMPRVMPKETGESSGEIVFVDVEGDFAETAIRKGYKSSQGSKI
jgi:hypothetical protein